MEDILLTFMRGSGILRHYEIIVSQSRQQRGVIGNENKGVEAQIEGAVMMIL